MKKRPLDPVEAVEAKPLDTRLRCLLSRCFLFAGCLDLRWSPYALCETGLCKPSGLEVGVVAEVEVPRAWGNGVKCGAMGEPGVAWFEAPRDHSSGVIIIIEGSPVVEGEGRFSVGPAPFSCLMEWCRRLLPDTPPPPPPAPPPSVLLPPALPLDTGLFTRFT